MNPLTRLTLALAAGTTGYVAVRRACTGRLDRTERSRYARSVIAWAVGLIAYAFVIETAGVFLTWEWFVECLFGGDWIFVCVASPVMALGELLLSRRTEKSRPQLGEA